MSSKPSTPSFLSAASNSRHVRYFAFGFFAVALLISLHIFGPSIGSLSLHHGQEPDAAVPSDVPIPEPQVERNYSIPNHLHLLYALKDDTSNFNFQFKNYLCLYGAVKVWEPEKIYFHTNAGTEAIDRARSGAAGKWSQLILNHPGIIINHVELQTNAGNGMEITGMEARSDFARAKVLQEYGGYYVDFDVHALRDIRPLLKSGYKAIIGIEFGGLINLGVVFTAARSLFIDQWVTGMNAAFDGGYVTHSNHVGTKIRQHLEGHGNELLVVSQTTFHPVDWTNEGRHELWVNHDFDDGTFTNNLANHKDGDPLPSFEHEYRELEQYRWDAPGQEYLKPEWSNWNWRRSYMVHAFRNHAAHNYEHISPRYVLERRSEYARMVYPWVWEMYRDGIVSIHDDYLGKLVE
ncbi:unnamed protein product [Clonostachys solani]|uniref:Uncharacterized protein n=1 Tax=Clonostachys solani TaxID=160281 RepID=A0A9N9Z9C5_9HYPO|nr:unnamed protein product [Clonostachys solani]